MAVFIRNSEAMANILSILILCCTLSTISCSEKNQSKPAEVLTPQMSGSINQSKKDTLLFPAKELGTFECTKDIDLKGNVYIVPKGVTLVACGGLIKNGTLVGNTTKILDGDCIFDNVQISGTWDVSNICTGMFKDISEENALKNVFALASEDFVNTIMIEEGNYQVSAFHKSQKVLTVPSHTEVIINGSITLAPNNLTNYYILYIQGSDINIHGRGSIVGDKFTHTGSAGEWGMGVNLHQCTNVTISDLTIKNCWGDCIYIGGESNNVNINNCILDNGRRQGISITSADSVYISNCLIKNISGTDPEYAIDIEPNKGDRINIVSIANCNVEDCKGGYMCWGGAKNANIGTIRISNCSVKGNLTKYPYSFTKVENLHLQNCIGSKKCIFVKDVKNSYFENNKIKNQPGSNIYLFDDCAPTSMK